MSVDTWPHVGAPVLQSSYLRRIQLGSSDLSDSHMSECVGSARYQTFYIFNDENEQVSTYLQLPNEEAAIAREGGIYSPRVRGLF